MLLFHKKHKAPSQHKGQNLHGKHCEIKKPIAWLRGASEDCEYPEVIDKILTSCILFRKRPLVFLGSLRPDHKEG